MHAAAGYVSPNEILADVTSFIDDEQVKQLSEGFHLSSIQKAMSELAFDTLFDERVFTAPVGNLIIPLPDGLFNIDRVYLYNGTECNKGTARKVWMARNFNRNGGSFKEQQGRNGGDPFLEDTVSNPGSILYYNTRAGFLMLSDACASGQSVMVEYRGMGVKIGDAPIVPHQFRRAVTDWVTWEALKVLKARGWPPAKDLMVDIKRDLFGGNGPLEVGSWKQAKRRAQSIDIGARNDIRKYLSNLSLKII
jgi:hypothetical protein